MSTTTPNLGLVKPALTDPADITKLNENWDKIDELITYGTEDLVAGTSPLETGRIYVVYE